MLPEGPSSNTTGNLPGSPLSHATRLLGPTAAVRIPARLRRGMLDRALTDGADPAASSLIAARTTQLGSSSIRARIADGLERLALSADNPRGRFRILPSRRDPRQPARAARARSMLRRDRPLYARGVAMLNVIITDGTRPAYTDPSGDALTRQLQIARASLTS